MPERGAVPLQPKQKGTDLRPLRWDEERAIADITRLREACRELAVRLEGPPDWTEMRAVYLDFSVVVGQLQGAVAETLRSHGETEATRQAQGEFDQLQTLSRRVGLDIRLVSEPALQLGLQAALRSASDTLDWLERATG